jgi:predicted RNA binding protein YcfA (HicA-like mRNA interferase family)
VSDLGLSVEGKALVIYLCKTGYYIKRIHGSHYLCVRQDGTGVTLNIPVHSNEDIARGTLRFIITVYARNENITEEEAKKRFQKL